MALISIPGYAIQQPVVSDYTITVHETFNDQLVETPLAVYQNEAYCTSGCSYATTPVHRPGGYSLTGDHAVGDTMLILQNLTTALIGGVYFRYYIYFDSNYLFPGEEGVFDNIKMMKFAGDGCDIEFIYKNSADGGPSSLQLYWIGSDGTITGNGTGTGSTTLGGTLSKVEWHKIEIYIKLGNSYSEQEVHVQVDDYDVYQDSGVSVNFRLPASAYTGTQQFHSIRGSNAPPAGQGYIWLDDVTVAESSIDLCDNEPAEP